MEVAAIVCFWLLVVLVVFQTVMVGGLTRGLLRTKPFEIGETTRKVAVVLCLRGTDPFLPDCISAILAQDYSNFDLLIVIDNESDPARAVVEQCLRDQSSDNVYIHFLSDRKESCSLKCSSIVHAVSSLDDSYEIVAQLDADVIPHSTWLAELVSAFDDDRVGAATGNRWYMPDEPSLAALVRHIWNSAAISQMYWYRIPWGGTLAVRTDVIRDAGLLDLWSKAFCEDTMLFKQLRRHGKRVRFVPSLMMVNRESCDLIGLTRWISRQLLTSRLYHPSFLATLAHGVAISLLPAAAIAVLIASLFLGQSTAASWSVAGLALFLVSLFLAWPAMEIPVRRIVKHRGESTRWLSPKTMLLFLVASSLTQIVYGVALTRAVFRKQVDWRGVSYRVDAPFRIRMLEYRPYQTGNEAGSEKKSL
jgi:cellulose synthase/poly-beta-1,6-N-acetylglucosamine synthase-like glycosyltransferase